MKALSSRFPMLIAAWLPLALAAGGCSSKQTSPVQSCDSGGADLIAFASDRGHHGQYDIYLYDANGLGYRLLRNLNSATASDSSPSLSGDNLLIAFVSARGTTDNDLFLYARSTCSFVPLPGVNSPSDDTEPAFSMDALRLAFVRDTLGHKRIRLLTAGTTPKFMPLPGLDSLTATFDDYSPAPDLTGDNIVFVSDREGSPHLYLYERAAQRVDTLLVTRGADGVEVDPSITPDQRFVCFASNRSSARGGFDICLYNRTTGQPVPLPGVNTAFDERHPSINAAGTTVAYQSDSSSTGTWCIRYCIIGSPSVPATISRNDASANDIRPSMVFP